MKPTPADRRRTFSQLGVIAGVAVVVIAMVATAVLLGRRAESGGAPQVSTTVTVNGVPVPFAVTGSAVRLGPADA